MLRHEGSQVTLHIVGQEHVLILVLVRVLLFELSRELQQFVVPLLAFLFLSVLLLASVAQLQSGFGLEGSHLLGVTSGV